MEGEYGMYRRYEEFQETDVWSVWNERKDNFDSDSVKSKGSSSSLSLSSSIPTAARMIPRRNTNNPDNESRIPQRQSAPVNIPDWSKIYGKPKRSSQNSAWFDYGYNYNDDTNDNNDHNGKESWDSDDDDDDDDNGDGNIMPPHEWIAQKLARSQISSFSVFEGAGRTLKGRDLSRVRNAILTKTGFLE